MYRLMVVVNLQGQRSFGYSDLMEWVIFNPPSVADPDTVQIFKVLQLQFSFTKAHFKKWS